MIDIKFVEGNRVTSVVPIKEFNSDGWEEVFYIVQTCTGDEYLFTNLGENLYKFEY